MQLASYGTRALPARYLSRLIPHNPGIKLSNPGRSIHIGPLPRSIAAGTAQKLVQQSRNVLTRFFAHLTAPGLRAPPSSFPTPSRSLHTASRTGIQGIHANLSLPARHTLSRGPFLPRAPVVPRTMTQVGLGTARNFSSARPIFQNLAQNVPVIGRAFWEADWEIHSAPRDEYVKVGKENFKKQEKMNEMLKPNKISSSLFTVQPEAAVVEESDSEVEHYFPTPTVRSAGLTTYLLIPLAPTPTSRHPLSSSPPPRPRNRRDAERLLPIPELAALHTFHTTHALRISSLFARLDEGNVWDKGVACDAYSSTSHSYGDYGDDQGGVCTILRVSFTGWSAAEVRSVIGESGTGWCELHEVRSDSGTPSSLSASASDIGSEDESMSDLSSVDADAGARLEMNMDRMDPSQSFVLPRIDFSSSSLSSPVSPNTTLSPRPSSIDSSSRHLSERDVDLFSYASSDSLSDFDSRSSSGSDSGVSSTFFDSFHDSSLSSGDGSWAQEQQPSWYGSSRFGFGFSSEFVARLGSEQGGEGPREHMF